MSPGTIFLYLFSLKFLSPRKLLPLAWSANMSDASKQEVSLTIDSSFCKTSQILAKSFADFSKRFLAWGEWTPVTFDVKKISGRGGGILVSVVANCCDDLILIPAGC